ncbi:hypothetical protein [Patiriisocius sp. Uisw_017]|jgi:hypothetical protein|uniref:hypothetical protein n=1 Tax=Patiriisocius sp. Uisw_017 TaxID=3230968 RepID=UPI0039E8803C
MGWVFLIGIVGVVIFYFLKDRNKMLETTVDNEGGMRQKYRDLIGWLTDDPNAKVTKVTRDHVEVTNKMPTTTTTFFITENFDGVDIEWNAQLGAMGNHKQNWKFPKGTSEENMVIKIGTDLQSYEQKMYG